MASYLQETLRYTYANLLRDGVFSICLTAVDEDGVSNSVEIADALEPKWKGECASCLRWKPTWATAA